MPASGLLLLGLQTAQGEDRTQARLQVRQALREVPGLPERLTMPGASGVSVSHASGYSVVAVSLHGAVGIDLMRLDAGLLPDWAIVARDYLGPAATARIVAASDHLRMVCFAQEWTRREAQLKMHGLPLVEWASAPVLEEVACTMLALPSCYVGSVMTQARFNGA